MTFTEGTALLLLVLLLALLAFSVFGIELHALILHVGNALDSATAGS